ncbi:MAG: hypothetical protein ABIO65_04730 [Nitrospiria bacterium]
MASDKNSIILNAQRLTAKGEIDKAIEAWKSLIAETPNDGNIFNTIGDLYLKKNAKAQAIEAFLKAGTTFQSAGFALKTIAVYKKIIKLDPSRMDVVLKLADVNAERGIVGNAVEDYLKVARHELKEGRVKAGIGVYRKIAALDPANPAIGLKLAELCQKEGLAAEAREELIRVAGQLEAAGKTDDLSKIRAKLVELGGPAGPEPAAASASAPAAPEFVLEGNSQASAGTSHGSINEITAAAEPVPPRGGEETLTPAQDQARPAPARVKATEYGETTRERVTDALAEADVYIKYGMIDKAVAHVVALAERDPGNVGIQLKLKELYVGQSDLKAAAEVCIKLASIYQLVGQESERQAVLSEAANLDPERIVSSGSGTSSAGAALSRAPEPQTAACDPASGAVGAADTLEQDIAEADFYFQQGFDDEARRLFSAIVQKTPGHPLAVQRLQELAERAPLVPPSVEAAPEPASEPVAQFLEETSLGSQIVVPGLESVPPPPRRGDTTQEEEEYIDLIDALRGDMERSLPPQEEELSQDLSAEHELEDVFRKFQQGVQEQYGKEDYETHYNLGIAYREMGLINEAIGEFRLVMKSPDRLIPATSMLATCYREKGVLQRAEETLLEILRNPAYHGVPGVAGLAYELGQILEIQARFDDALAQYYRVREMEPDHKEAKARIAQLECRSPVPSAPPAAPVPVSAAAPEPVSVSVVAAPTPALPKVVAPQPVRRDQKKKVSYL